LVAVIIAILLATLLTVMWCTGRGARQADEVVAQLSTLPHGLNRLSPENQKFLERIRRKPDDYLPAIRERVRLPADLPSWLDAQRRSDFFGALGLLFAIGDSGALTAVEGTQGQVLDYMRGEWEVVRDYEDGRTTAVPPVVEFLLSAERTILSGLEKAGSDRAVPQAIDLIRIADYATALSALQYIASVAAQDTNAVRATVAAASDSGSALADDPMTTQILKNLSARVGLRLQRTAP
jgi:hypothetical protein